MATGSEDTTIKLWNLKLRNVEVSLCGHTEAITAL